MDFYPRLVKNRIRSMTVGEKNCHCEAFFAEAIS